MGGGGRGGAAARSRHAAVDAALRRRLRGVLDRDVRAAPLPRVRHHARADGVDRAQRAQERGDEPEGHLPRPAHARRLPRRAVISTPFCLYDCDVPVRRRHRVRASRTSTPRATCASAPLRVEAVGAALHGRPSWDQFDDLTTMALRDAAKMLWNAHRPDARRRGRRRVLRRLQLHHDGVARGARLLRQGRERAVHRGRRAHRARRRDPAQHARRPALGRAPARLRLPARGVRAALGRRRRAPGAGRTRGRGRRGRRRPARRMSVDHEAEAGGGTAMADQQETGKTASVVGGASGMARATAEMLVREGARVAILDLPELEGRGGRGRARRRHALLPVRRHRLRRHRGRDRARLRRARRAPLLREHRRRRHREAHAREGGPASARRLPRA